MDAETELFMDGVYTVLCESMRGIWKQDSIHSYRRREVYPYTSK